MGKWPNLAGLGGIAFLGPYIVGVRKHFDTFVAVQVHPPRTNDWIDRTYAMGVDALSYNLELFDAQLLMRHCVGRARYELIAELPGQPPIRQRGEAVFGEFAPRVLEFEVPAR